MSDLRRIQSLNRTGLRCKNPGPPSDMVRVKISQLRVNDSYQRSLTAGSINLIRKIANGFDWSRYKAPNIVAIDEVDEVTGLPLYEVVDGQHTAIGAATNGYIQELLCVLGSATSIEERAKSFVGINKTRLNVSPMTTFWAQVKAGDEDALEVVAACESTGARVLRSQPSPLNFRVGDTMSPIALMKLARLGGRRYVQRVLEVAVACELAPIPNNFIGAFQLLLLGTGDLRLEEDYSLAKLALVLAVKGREDDLVNRATVMHRAGKVPMARALAYHIKQDVERL